MTPSSDPYEATLTEADTLREGGRRDEAIRHYEMASSARPDRIYPLYWIATLLAEKHEYARSAHYALRGLAIEPREIGLLLHMGTLSAIDRDPFAAWGYFERARQLDPDIPDIDSLVAEQLCHLGRADEAAPLYTRALARDPASRPLHTARLFCLNLGETVSPESLAAEHRAWGQALERRTPTLPRRVRNAGSRPVRIGYVSPDLRAHAVPYFLLPLLDHRDRARFEHVVFDISTRQEDALTARLRSTQVTWHSCAALGDDEVAKLVQDQSIDVLIDLAGHTSGSRLEIFARKPAPVQVTWLGYLGTTGLTRMDYRITDAFMDPPGMTDHLHTERLKRLPVHACFAPLSGTPPLRPSPARARGGPTLGSVNQWAKVSPRVRDVWAAILARNDRARLVIVARGGQNQEMQRMIVDEFARRGARASQVEVVPFLETPQYLDLLGEIDVALDPFPYGGGTTTFQCLWMGVPVVSLAGRTPFARNAIGPLHGVGLGDLVANTPAEYVEIVDRLGRDTDRLEHERQTLRQRMSASLLVDGAAFARSFESACEEMLKDAA